PRPDRVAGVHGRTHPVHVHRDGLQGHPGDRDGDGPLGVRPALTRITAAPPRASASPPPRAPSRRPPTTPRSPSLPAPAPGRGLPAPPPGAPRAPARGSPR